MLRITRLPATMVMTTKMLSLLIVLAIMALSVVPAAYSATLTEHMDIECRQPEALSLHCDYRILSGADLISSLAEHSQISVAGEISTIRPDYDDTVTATLFLVDTSDPARESVITKNRDHIQHMVALGSSHHVYGLAAFDSLLEMLCDLGCSNTEIIEASNHLQAKGKTTELYRNLLEAIKELRAFDAARRQIILMSDGLAEDLAYYHEDVIAAARSERIVISAIGYPRSVPQSVALQTLRRLSEETGGLFIQASNLDYQVPDTFFTRAMSAIDDGGRVSFSLDALQQQGVEGNVELSLAFQTTEQSFAVLVPVSLPVFEAAAESPAADRVIADTSPVGQLPATPDSAMAPTSGSSSWNWFWYGLPAMVFSAFLAVALAYALMTRRRREEHSQFRPSQSTPHAFLVSADNDQIRYKIDQTPWRIGRSRSSNLTLDDTSVSRLHAEIRRDALGQFTLQDLESLNGVFVNGEAVEMTHLDENDRVEIGDVAFVFSFHDEDYSQQEPTVLVRTITPK